MSGYFDYKRLTLLVLDDDPSLLKFFKIHLGSQFSSVIVLNNPQDAAAVIDSHTVDIVLTDYEMPGLNGLDICQLVRAKSPAIPVLMVTGAELDAAYEDALKEEVDGFLRKPFDISELAEALEVCVAARRQALKMEHQQLVRLSLRSSKQRRIVQAGLNQVNLAQPKKVVGSGG